MCGEHATALPLLASVTGSSPRVRGTCISWEVHYDRLWDHPRVCGEHQAHAISLVIHTGSSPRVRGTCSNRTRTCISAGIIPACAGNIFACGNFDFNQRDHPRVCGEHATQASAENNCLGSSPRVRGTLLSLYYHD